MSSVIENRDQLLAKFEKLKSIPQYVINNMTTDEYYIFSNEYISLHFELFPLNAISVPSQQKPFDTKKYDNVREKFKKMVLQSLDESFKHIKYPNNPRDFHYEFTRTLKDKVENINYLV
ncbi:hypothetical protein QJ854_gp819 [Moumouvirus goulette]|uniref:Uncharacterized protein n=1 Tax=Moumouvirus goulette TaxID=1247379 RepID=M1PG64_9VIRU|nr:hypothetical protein QJ854_gp819 [Moumouvirus goulette]AGF84963.1 hypothetical protein glt_00154 [Moumouvirus goulette]